MCKNILNLVLWSTLFIPSFVPHTHTPLSPGVQTYGSQFFTLKDLLLFLYQETASFHLMKVPFYFLFCCWRCVFFFVHNNAFIELFPQPFFAIFCPHSYNNLNRNIPTQQNTPQPHLSLPINALTPAPGYFLLCPVHLFLARRCFVAHLYSLTYCHCWSPVMLLLLLALLL